MDYVDYQRPNVAPELFDTKVFTRNEDLLTYTIDEQVHVQSMYNCYDNLYETLRTFDFVANGRYVYIKSGGTLLLGHHYSDGAYPYACNRQTREKRGILNEEFPIRTISQHPKLFEVEELHADAVEDAYIRNGIPFVMLLTYTDDDQLFYSDGFFNALLKGLHINREKGAIFEQQKVPYNLVDQIGI